MYYSNLTMSIFCLLLTLLVCKSDVQAQETESSESIESEILALINQAKEVQYDNTQQSLEIIEKAISLTEQHDKPVLMANAIGGRSLLYGYLGDHKTAIKDIETALAIVTPLENQYRKALVLSFAGFTYMRADRPEEALFYYQQAQEIYVLLPEDHQDRKQDILNNMSEIYMLSGQYDQVLRILHAIEVNAEEFNIGDAVTYFQIADAYTYLEQPDNALPYAQQVLDWGIVKKHRFGEAQGNFILGKVKHKLWQTSNDKTALEEALQHYQKALQFSYQLPDKRIDHLVKLIGYAEILVSLNKVNDAKITLQEALPLAIRINEWEEEIKVRELLIELLEKEDPDTALEHAQSINVLSKNNHRLVFSSKLAGLLIDHDVVSKQNRIQRISFENQTLENRQFTILLAAGLGSLLIVLLGGYTWRTMTFKARQKQLETEVNTRTQELQTSESKYRELFNVTLKEKERTEEALRLERIAIQNNLNFIDMISHEYRTPLAVIDSSLDLLKQGTESPVNSVGRMKHSVQKLLHLFETSLSELRVNDDFIIKKAEVVSLNVFVRMIVDYARKAFPEHMIMSEFNDIDEVCKVDMDPDLMNIALTNIIDNACKYSGEETPIKIILNKQTTPDGSFATIEIIDNGRGIASDELPSIFEKYYRASSGKTEKGTGVGLFLVNRIVEMHGGEIKVSSIIGEGSRFTVTLPLTNLPLNRE